MEGFYCCNSDKIKDQFSFVQHYLHGHFEGATREKVDFHCTFCSRKVTYFKNLVKHFQTFHYELVEKFYPRSYNQHSSTSQDFHSSELNSLSDLNSYHLESSDQDSNSSSDDEYSAEDEHLSSDEDKDENSSVNQANFVAQNTTVQEPIQLSSNAAINLNEEMSNLILLGKRDLKMNQNAIIKYTNALCDILIRASINGSIGVTTINLINDYVKSPYQIRKTVLKDNKSTGNSSLIKYESTISNGQKAFFYHIPLSVCLNKIFSTDHIMNKIFEEKKKPPNQQCMRTFKDGQLFTEQSVERSSELTIQFKGFFDDFSRTKRNSALHKFCVVLLSLNNLPHKSTAKRTDMFLSLIGKRKFIDQIGIDAFFKPLLEEIKHFDGLRKTVNDLIIRIKITQFTGDNLAIHELMKLTRCFRRDSCRFCLITYQQLQQLNMNLEVTERLLNEDHCLLEHFDSPFNYSVDIFHDLCHGVILKLMSFILVTYYKGKYDQLLVEYNKVKVKHGRIEGIKVSTGKIVGTGMQVLDFFLLFGYLDKCVDRRSVHWKLYRLLRDIILFCFHPVVYQRELPEIHRKIIDFQLIFFNKIVFPTKNMNKIKKITFTMKIHYIGHYVRAVFKSGPLLNSCTLKGERVLSSLNNYLIASNNRKNEAFTIASWYLYNFNTTAFRNTDKYHVIRTVKIDEIKDTFGDGLELRILNHHKDVQLIGHCHHNDVNYKLGDLFLFGYQENKMPIFIELFNIFKQDDQVKIIGQIIRTSTYDAAKCVYKVFRTADFEELKLDQIEWHQPIYFFEDQFVLEEFKPKWH